MNYTLYMWAPNYFCLKHAVEMIRAKGLEPEGCNLMMRSLERPNDIRNIPVNAKIIMCNTHQKGDRERREVRDTIFNDYSDRYIPLEEFLANGR